MAVLWRWSDCTPINWGIVTVAVSCVPSSPLERKNENNRRGAVLKLRPRVLVRAGPYLIINQGHDITNGGFRQTKPLEELFVVVKLNRVLPLSHSVRSSVHCGFLFLNSLLNFVRNDGEVFNICIPPSRTCTLPAALSALTVD